MQDALSALIHANQCLIRGLLFLEFKLGEGDEDVGMDLIGRAVGGNDAHLVRVLGGLR